MKASPDWRAERTARLHENFAAHRAEIRTATDGDRVVEMLRWSRPSDGQYRIHYTAVGAWLFVTGDVGDAVYERAGGLDWWAKCDLGYFASKCMASPHGRGYRAWEPKQAKASAIYHLPRDRERRAEFFRTGGVEATYSQFDWYRWLDRHGYDVYHDVCELGEIGMVVDWECESHLLGLKLALAQLNASGATAAGSGSAGAQEAAHAA